MKPAFIIIALIAFILPPSISSAQEVITAAGGNAEGTGGSVSYSAGQLFFMTHTGENGSVAEGVQQPYEISVVTSVAEAEGIGLVVSAFPNPVTDHLVLRIDRYDPANIIYQLFDANGRIVQIGKAIGPDTIIDMTGLSSAIYFLKVFDGLEEIKVFRILKF